MYCSGLILPQMNLQLTFVSIAMMNIEEFSDFQIAISSICYKQTQSLLKLAAQLRLKFCGKLCYKHSLSTEITAWKLMFMQN